MNVEQMKKQRDQLIQQRDNAFAAFQQATGALVLLDHLLSQAMNANSSEEAVIEPPQEDATQSGP